MFDEDLDVFFNEDEHGTRALLNDGVQVVGILRSEAVDLIEMNTAEPSFQCKTAAIPGVKVDDSLRVCECDYRIVDVKHDGTGVTVLRLVKG